MVASRYHLSAEVIAKIESASRTYGLAVDPKGWWPRCPSGFAARRNLKGSWRGCQTAGSSTSQRRISARSRCEPALRDPSAKQQGHSVVFISHKLAEVIEICDEVVVLRDDRYPGRAALPSECEGSRA